MRYIALASDYDGTLAHDGKTDEQTVAALEQLCASGRKLILVTGRELDDLIAVFPAHQLCDLIVAENGAVVYRPALRERQVLCDPPPQALIDRLSHKHVPFSAGSGILATWQPHEFEVLDAIRELGLEHHVIFNKGAVMVLPSGVNKCTGLTHALKELKLSNHNVVGVGDAENDHAFLSHCEFAVAVANALPSLKERADFITQGARGAGVQELIQQILEDDLQSHDAPLQRRRILIGKTLDGQEICSGQTRGGFLFAGPSGSGKSTAVGGVLERIAAQGYQFCLIDPEGDYENFAGALSVGAVDMKPDAREVLKALENPVQNVVVNLLGLPLADRPVFFTSLLAELQALRSRTARPHWIVVDEAHHLMPAQWKLAVSTIPQQLGGLILITVHPDHVSEAVLRNISIAIAIGTNPSGTLETFASVTGRTPPVPFQGDLDTGQALVWFTEQQSGPVLVKTVPAERERKRHLRKYASGELPADRSFYFTGPERKLKLRAQNLATFLQLAEGVDAETWLHHLAARDYSRWFREALKDEDLAAEVERIEEKGTHSAEESRTAIKSAIERRYTAAA